jgi:hypothetical protein
MKTIAHTLLIIVLTLVSEFTYAYWEYPFAITKDGLLVGKFKKTIDTQNSIPSPITIEEAKNITALTVLALDENKLPYKVTIVNFQMTIHEVGDTITIKGTGESLSREMKDRLQQIKSESKIYFEGINVMYAKEEYGASILLAFIVN